VDESPKTWHYGLIARWWAEFNAAEPHELAYYRAAIERYGQPALDAGCGTGRLLIPLLADGLDVDGADISPDMLALCREHAAARGLQPRLHAQAMHELDTGRRYRTVFIYGSFGIGGVRDHDRTALSRIHSLLEPGGALLINHEMPYAAELEWSLWRAGDDAFPQPWPADSRRRRAANGDEIELASRIVQVAPLMQTFGYEMRARLWRGANLISEELRTLKGCLYVPQELKLMLELAGFASVDIEGNYTSQPATRDDMTLVFVARK
jgi:SAM-dependent methyltransferase